VAEVLLDSGFDFGEGLGLVEALEDSVALELAESEACSLMASSFALPKTFELEKDRLLGDLM
jgi:hypothetical protein